MTKEEQITINRLKDMAHISFNKDIPMYSDFLNLSELNLFTSIKKELPKLNYNLYGGHSYAERKIVGFFPLYMEPLDEAMPIRCLKVTPAHIKFSQELNHRDFLGAIINLGIDRAKIGDIVVKDNEAFIFCYDNIADFIEAQLFEIKRTQVHIEIITDWKNVDFNPRFRRIEGTVSSVRLDTVTALGFSKSRSQITSLIEGGKVFVNSKMIQSNSYTLKAGDIISVRGLGKFVFKATQQKTKKGRVFILIDRFI